MIINNSSLFLLNTWKKINNEMNWLHSEVENIDLKEIGKYEPNKKYNSSHWFIVQKEEKNLTKKIFQELIRLKERFNILYFGDLLKKELNEREVIYGMPFFKE